jgi:hypothetical protein
VLRAWLNFLPRVGSPREFRPELRGRLRNPQFVSFMAQNNRRRIDTDLHDAVLRGRKLVKNLLRFALAGGCTWVVIESAKALSIF